MLAYLSLSRTPVRRELIAEMLWDRTRLGSVRQALYELRKLPGAESWLDDAGETVWVEVDSDVAAFEDAIGRGDTAAALTVYSGDLLEGLPEVDATPYQDWLSNERARLAEMRMVALVGEAASLEAVGRPAEALTVVGTALESDPINEDLHRAAMRLNYVLGDTAAAKEQFRTCVMTLRRELSVEPGEETLALARHIERGEPLALALELDALPAERRLLLQVLAVCDGAVGVRGIAEMLDRSELEVADDLEGLERMGLLGADLTVSPSHLKAVSSSLSNTSKRLLHERVATILSTQAGVEDAVVAHHLLAAGDPRGAAPHLLAAGRAAIDRAEFGTAADLLFRACWTSGDLPQIRIEACMLLEGLASQLGDEALQDRALSEAEVLAWELQSDPQLAEVRMRRSRLHLLKGRVGDGLELALEALEIAVRCAEPSLLARARNAVGGAHFYAGDLDGAVGAFSANLSAPDVVERYRSHSNIGSIAATRGDIETAQAQFEVALTLARSSGQKIDVAAALNNLAAIAERHGDYARAVRYFREGVDLSRRNQAAGREGRVLNNLAVVYARQGQLGPAWNTAAEMEELANQLSDPRLATSAWELKADIERLCGAFDRACDSMCRALEMARELKDERKSLTLEAQLASIEAARGADRVKAERAIEVVERGRWADLSPWLWLELSLCVREPEEAVRYLELASESGQRSVHQAVLIDIATVRASLLAASDEELRLRASDAAARLSAGEDAPGSLARHEIVERPLGVTVLTARETAGFGELPRDFEVPERVRLEVDEQAAGLPRELGSVLRLQPERWLLLMRP